MNAWAREKKNREDQPEMREILAGRLWIGNAGDAQDLRRLLDAGISVIVDLAAEQLPPKVPRSLIYCRFPIVDGTSGGQKVLAAAIQTVVVLLQEQMPTLVCCGAGMSRSPAIAAAVVSLLHGGTPDDRLREVVQGHPHDVSPLLWAAVKEVCLQLGEGG
jgi:hypothetical protein